MDASDEAIGCALQQVQEIHVQDLEGMKVYQQVRLEYEAGRPPPRLTSQVVSRFPKAEPKTTSWGPTMDEMTVEVECVIAYWLHTLKSAKK